MQLKLFICVLINEELVNSMVWWDCLVNYTMWLQFVTLWFKMFLKEYKTMQCDLNA